MSFRPLPRKWNNNMNLSVAQPSSAGLRGAYSESNLYQNDMYGGGLEEPRHYGSTPWIHDTSTMKYTAATNKYLQSTSSIFDDPRSRDSIRHQRGRQALEELKQQVAEKEAEKRREKEEEERILAAMNGPSYNPSFQEPNARRRSQGRAPVVAVDNAATVEDSGGGGYYGGLGGGYDAGGYNDEYGGYSSSGYDAYQSPQQNYYDAPQNFGRRRPQRYNANMTSEERDMVNRERRDQSESELQWQIQMKRQLDEEKKKKEQLEDLLMEKNIKQQQERMKQEYDAEQEKKRKKEEEQNRRREAQLRHMEMIQNQLQQEKESKQAKARAIADMVSSTPPSNYTNNNDNRAIKQPRNTQDTPKVDTPKPEQKRVPKKDDDFGLNLKSDSRFLEAQKPNKFFDSPTTPVKMARTAEDRKRPKPMPEVPYTVTRQAGAGGLHGPTKNSREQWESERKHEEPKPAVVKGAPFDWRVKIDDLTEEDKKKLNESTEDDIKHFKEENEDVMSQLKSMKTRLRPSGDDSGPFNPGGGGNVSGSQGRRRSPQDSNPTQSGGRRSGGSNVGGYEPSFAGGTPPRTRTRGQSGGNPPTIPAGDSEGVDYIRITTPNSVNNEPPRDPPFNPDDTDGTTLRKFLARTANANNRQPN